MWKEAIAAGQADPFGVRIINQYAASDGQAYCVTEAPDADAIRKSHEAVGAPPPDTITEVQSIA